jgi:hypothetical protein
VWDSFLVFDDAIEVTTSVYTDPKFNADLATADELLIMGVVTQVTGTSPTITVQIEHSADNRNFANKTGTAEINGVTISTTPPVIVSGNDPGTTPLGGFVRLRIALGGTTPKARVKIWVTGRTS